MKNYQTFSLCVSLLVSTLISSCSPKTVDPINYRIRFGIVETDNDGNRFISKETNVVPMIVGEKALNVGYEIIALDHHPYRLYTVTHLPSPPATIEGNLKDSNPSVPTSDVTSSVTEIKGDPVVDYYWFTPGDPLGRWSIDVFVNDTRVKTIPFDVQKN